MRPLRTDGFNGLYVYDSNPLLTIFINLNVIMIYSYFIL